MLKKIFFYVLAFVVVLALIVYYWLGGFNPVVIEVVNHPGTYCDWSALPGALR